MRLSSFRKHKISLMVTLLNLILGFSHSAKAAEKYQISIIAGSAIESIDERQIQRYFTLQQKLLPNNQLISLFRLPMDDATTAKFSGQVFNYYPYQLQRIWDRQIYAGKAKPLIVAGNDQEMIRQIANTPHALGYISASTPIPEELKGMINVVTSY